MYGKFKFLAVVVCLAGAVLMALAQDKTYTRADFINIDGSSLKDKIDRGARQFKSSNQGDTVWLAYHFPARQGASIGPFSGMVYYDDGIRLERRNDVSQAAVFLLVDASGSGPKINRVLTLNLSEPFVFEKRPVYWLGNVAAAESMTLLEGLLTGDQEGRNLARGALRAISHHDDPRVVNILRNVASRDSSIDIQRAAVSNLAGIKSPAGLDALIELYESSTSEMLKVDIISGISRDKSSKAADKLQSIAKNDPNPKLRQRAIRRLSSGRGLGLGLN